MLAALALLPMIAMKPTVNDLKFLTGTWTLERNGRVTTEHWMPPAGNTMLGLSRTVAGERTLEYEFLAILADGKGDIVYRAKPSGQAETDFKLAKVAKGEAVFENLAHDFPQRIIYRLQKDGGLLAAIEGTRGGQTRRIEFPYRRAR